MRRTLLLLVALWALAYLPTLGVRNFRLEEGRRSTPALEMLHTGDFLTPRLFGETYLSKPPLYFWIVAGTKTLIGGAQDQSPTRWHWATRLPSAVGALLGALVLLGFARRTLPQQTRAIAALAWLATVILLDKGTLGELDALLSSLLLLSLALLYDAFDRDPQGTPTVKHWAWAGLPMAAAVLMKGPGGPLEFYSALPLFLLVQVGVARTVRILLSPGHLLFILLSLLPTAVWVAALMAQDHLTIAQLGNIWGHQAALDEVGLMPSRGPASFPWERYATFLPGVFTMTLPWSLVAVPALLPPVARWAGLLPPRHTVDPQPAVTALYRFLAAGMVGITLVFYLYPGAQERHMMGVAFQSTTLAVLLLCSPTLAEKLRPRFPKAWASVPEGPLPAIAAGVAISVLIGWAIASTIFVIKKAPSDITAIAHGQIDARLPTDRPAYTTRTFASSRGNGYYNILFYADLRLGQQGGLRALPEEVPLPPGPFTLIAAPEDLANLPNLPAVPSSGMIGVVGRSPEPLFIYEVPGGPASPEFRSSPSSTQPGPKFSGLR